MRNILTACLALAISATAFAQTADVALAMAEEQYEGSARTMAMGNAFTALGGDIGAVGINPAGAAVMRNSQFSITPTFNVARSTSDYLSGSSKDRNTRFGISNGGVIWSFDSGAYNGLLNFNFGFVYSGRNNFNSYIAGAGNTGTTSMLSSHAANLSYDHVPFDKLEGSTTPYSSSGRNWSEILAWNTYALATIDEYSYDQYISSTENLSGGFVYVAGDLHQKFNRQTYGSNDEFALNFSANISDKVFLGMNVNLLSVNYNVNENYSETSINPSEFQDGFVSMQQNYWMRSSGAGVNLKFGAIVTPVKGLRLGATITTPSWYTMTDTWGYRMTTSFNNGNTYPKDSPTGTYDYKLTTPFRFSVGAAFVFGTGGLLSADYERVDYSSTKFRTPRNSFSNDIDFENQVLRSNGKAANIFRVGGEYWILGLTALRAGYASYGSTDAQSVNTQFVSGGLGWRFGKSSLDFTYQHRLDKSENFVLYEYNDPASSLRAPVGSVKTNGSRFTFTWTMKL